MIIRVSRRRYWTVIENTPIEDNKLSFRALGILTYLLSRPDNWVANRRHLATVHAEGEAAVAAGLAELVRAGYLERKRERDPLTGHWQWVQLVHECPECGEAERLESEPAGHSMVGNPRDGEPRDGYPALVLHAMETPPRTSTREQQLKTKTENNTARAESTARFDEHFWPTYPERDGKKVGRAKALAEWLKLSLDDQRSAVKGARHYAASGWRAKDAERWLRDRLFEDWQTPATPSSTGHRAADAGHDGNMAELRELMGYERG